MQPDQPKTGKAAKRKAPAVKRNFPAIDEVTRPKVDTALAAHWLGREAQTLRSWSCHQNGPLQPVLVHGRLAWDVAEIKRLLQVEEVAS